MLDCIVDDIIELRFMDEEKEKADALRKDIDVNQTGYIITYGYHRS